MRIAVRFLISGFALAGFSHVALAQNYGPTPVLRGSDYRPVPPTYRNWAGFYAGGQIGYSSASGDLSSGENALLAKELRNTILAVEFEVPSWPSMASVSNSGTPAGFFFGYNWQSDNAVYGVEFNYNKTKHSLSASDSLGRIATSADGYSYNITATTGASAEVTDFASFRLRGGAVYGTVLPYLTVGVAVGRMSVHQTAQVSYPAPTHPSDPPLPAYNSGLLTQGKNNAYALGLSAGIGFDWEVMPHVFLRGEYEYVGFAEVNDVSIGINTARLGIGLKF